MHCDRARGQKRSNWRRAGCVWKTPGDRYHCVSPGLAACGAADFGAPAPSPRAGWGLRRRTDRRRRPQRTSPPGRV